MALPDIRAIGSTNGSASAIEPGLPAGTSVGDLLLMFIESGGATTGTEANTEPTASGWALYKSVKKGNTRATVLYRIATGADPALTNDTGDHQIGRIIGVKAGTFDPANPFNTGETGTQTATKSGSIPGATTTIAECLVFGFLTGNLPDAVGTAEFSGWTNASLGSVTERIDNTMSNGDGGALGVVTGTKSTAGTYEATTVTCATEAERACISFAISRAAKALTAELSDTVSLSDSVVKGPAKPLGDSVGLSDAVAKASARPLTDSVALSDDLAKGSSKGLSEVVALSDAITKDATHQETDELTLSDAVSKEPGHTEADALTLSDALGKGIEHVESDTIVLSDSLGKRAERILSDAVSLADSLVKGTVKAIADLLGLSDSVSGDIAKPEQAAEVLLTTRPKTSVSLTARPKTTVALRVRPRE